jgi:hypothetical protein
MKRALAALAAALMLVSIASALPSAEVSLDSDGNANLRISDERSSLIQTDTVSLIGSSTGEITITENAEDPMFALMPDYTISANSSAGSKALHLRMTDRNLYRFTNIGGEFNLSARVENNGGILTIDVYGNLTWEAFEDLTLLDVYAVQEDLAGTKSLLESAVNDAFSELPFLTNPSLKITSFSLSGDDPYQLRVSMELRDWGDFLTSLLYLYSQSNPNSYMACADIDMSSALSALQDAGYSSSISVKSDGTILDLAIATSSGGQPAQESVADTSNLQVSKAGSSLSMSGLAFLEDPSLFLKCIIQPEMPGDYALESFDYTLSAFSGLSELTIDAELTDMAQKSGSNWVVSFPAETTSAMNITLNAPPGMSIISVEGGQKTGDRSAVSTGGDFTVTYGKAGADYTMWMIAAVVIILLLALARKKKK